MHLVLFIPKKSHCRATGLQVFNHLAENNLVASMSAYLIVKLDLVRDIGAQDAEQCFYGLASH